MSLLFGLAGQPPGISPAACDDRVAAAAMSRAWVAPQPTGHISVGAHAGTAHVIRCLLGKSYQEVRQLATVALAAWASSGQQAGSNATDRGKPLVMNSIHLKTVQHRRGPKDIRTTLRYAHLSQEYLEAAVRILAQVLKCEQTGERVLGGS
jgi:hypothetical protein